jgi:transcriptional regulator with XRE-family HTH domain
LEHSGIKKAELARILNVDRSSVTQVFNGNGNVTVNTLAEYLAALGYEIDLQPVELGEILVSMREHRAPAVAEITNRDIYRKNHGDSNVVFYPDVQKRNFALSKRAHNRLVPSPSKPAEEAVKVQVHQNA